MFFNRDRLADLLEVSHAKPVQRNTIHPGATSLDGHLSMRDTGSLEELKDLGSGKPAPGDVARLHGEAFAEHRARALWNWEQIERPTASRVQSIQLFCVVALAAFVVG